ncbi:proline racemase family protein [Alkalihalobacillus deserti]|uniref:proline racemase family protein n=1 Tax=Alkalihalobacillus deserti TaxID=2879466 RepID=UPI001D133A21|nr:proline racemase family protein [Alkalihalobacillus deserti]
MKVKNEGSLVIKTIDTHTMGDPTRIVVEGLPNIEGKTMLEKKQKLIEEYDYIRSSLILEPRGHKDMFGAVLLEPVNPAADIGVVFMDTQAYLNMCGHGTIGVTTALLEMGLIEKEGEEVTLNLDTPAGLVTVRANKKNNRVESVSFLNVPAFYWGEEIKVLVKDLGEIHVDISFGGSFYAFVYSKDIKMDLIPENADRMAELGMKIRDAVNEQVKVEHPLKKEINKVDLVLFIDESNNEGIHTKNVAVFGDGQVARSACGTGLSAQMARLHAIDQLSLNEEFFTESIIETVFKGRLLEETTVGHFKAVIPEVTGNAYVMGKHEFYIHPVDPLSKGFLLKSSDQKIKCCK